MTITLASFTALWWGWKVLIILVALPFISTGIWTVCVFLLGLVGLVMVAWVKFQMKRTWAAMTPEEQARYRAAEKCRQMAEALRRQ